MSFIVAIDGPAGVGKGTIAKRVADDLGLITIDTGATYRSVTVAILENNIKLEELDKIAELLKNIKIELILEGKNQKVFLNGEDVTTNLQRKLAEGKNVIMEGRDIGTVVFPKANIKIFLDASLEERAMRRYKQNQETGIDKELSYDEVYESIKNRDYNDRNKPIGALKQAEDAILVDTTGMSLEDNIRRVEKLVKERMLENK